MNVSIFEIICCVFLSLTNFPTKKKKTDAFDYLDAPVERITGADVPMPYAKSIEDLAMVQVSHIVNAAKRACYRKQK